jgi:hypothetical protein
MISDFSDTCNTPMRLTFSHLNNLKIKPDDGLKT